MAKGVRRSRREGKVDEGLADLAPLEFANIGLRPAGFPGGGLSSFEDFTLWVRQVRLMDDQETWELARASGQRKPEALSVLRRAKSFRESAYRIIEALAGRHVPPATDLDVFNRELARAMEHAALATVRGELHWSWRAGDKPLERILWPIVLATADLLTSPDSKRIHRCAGPSCGRLFLDTSKNGSRRWCDMKTCGNRAKVRLHRQRRLEGLPPIRPARGSMGRSSKPATRQRRDDSFID